MNLTTISTTRESGDINGWIYRIIEDAAGASVYRVPVDCQLWGHGVLKQVYQVESGKFVPVCNNVLRTKTDLATALAAIVE